METSVDPPMDQKRSTNIPPPPSETDQKDLPPMDKSVREPQMASKGNEHSMTLSTKMSTDQLICKSPQHSPNGSVVSLKQRKLLTPNRILMSLGIFQFAFGFLMVLFGVYVIAYRASLSYVSILPTINIPNNFFWVQYVANVKHVSSIYIKTLHISVV